METSCNLIKGLGIGIAASLGIAGAVTGGSASGGLAIPILIPTVMAGIGAVEAAVTQGVLMTYVKKKIHRFVSKCDLVNCYLNRLYHLYHMSIEDKLINNEEYDEYKKLVNEYESEMKKFEVEDAGEVSNHKTIEHIAEVEAKKEYEAKLLEKMKEEKLEKMVSSKK